MLEQITKMVLAIALANAAVAIVMVPLSYIEVDPVHWTADRGK